MVGKNYVLKTLQSGQGNYNRCARYPVLADGEPVGNPRDGHIAGLKRTFLHGPRGPIHEQFQTYGSGKRLFYSCGRQKQGGGDLLLPSDKPASVVYLAGRSLGYDVKLYDGSMQEWSRIPELPMEITKNEPCMLRRAMEKPYCSFIWLPE